MTEINPYIRVLWLKELERLAMPDGYHRFDVFTVQLERQIHELLTKYGAPTNITNVSDLAQGLFRELMDNGVVIEEDHEFAGTYYTFLAGRYAQARAKLLENDVIFAASKRVGAKYFSDTFKGYLGQRNLDDSEAAARGTISLPASDRVVFLGDNVRDIVGDIEALKDSVRSHNDEDGKLDDRRERIVSELSAGQELLKAPSARAKAIVVVLMSTLTYIADAFAGGVIGELAVKLLEQLRPLLGL